MNVLAELQELNYQAGEVFFSDATLAFFGSVEMEADLLDDGRYLYSERQENAPVADYWSARIFDREGHVYPFHGTGDTRQEAIVNVLKQAGIA